MARRTTPRYLTLFGSGSIRKEKILDISRLDGGLNLWELDYRIDANQSPDMLNMWWVDGALGSRPGQDYVHDDALGTFFAMYERLYYNRAVAHIADRIYTINLETGEYTQRYTGLTQQGGTFFMFGSALYYLNGAQYIKIDSSFVVTSVVPYIPVTVINRTPAGTGGGTYQPENRLGAGKEVWFNADGTSTQYKLPYKDLDASPAMTADVNGTAMTEGSGFTVNRTTGVVTFSTAPANTDNNNEVKIKCYKSDADTQNSILTCRRAIVYGGDTDLAVVVGGPTAQPNGYFWSGSHDVADPTYFPFDYYNLAGATDEYITGFGRQQSMLVIFKEHSVGKSNFSTTTIDEREYLQLPYTSINTRIGCDLPGTIQLINNNLVFCNTTGGAYMVLDTTNAGENNIARLSRNVNGTEVREGLLHDLRAVAASAVCSLDDDQRYWVVANNHAYVWDYLLSPYSGYEEKLSWFYHENILARVMMKNVDTTYYGKATGELVKFTEGVYYDFATAIHQKFQFATQFFGSYEVLKDVTKVVLSVRSDTDTSMIITYKTDYETRQDLTPIWAWTYRFTPRDLIRRSLAVVPFGKVVVRNPVCFNIRHFSMILENTAAGSDMSLVSAQIVYRYAGGDR